MTSWHWGMFLLCVLVLVFDQMDNAIVNSVFPLLIKEWNITKFDIGVILAFGNAGAVIGATVFGRMADQYGRRKVFIWTIILFSVATAITALSANMYQMIALKAIAGLGLGGAAPLSALLLGEFAPAKWRGRLLAWWTTSFALGAIAAGLVGLYVVIPFGWRWGIAACGLTIFSAVLIRIFLPESPRFLAQKGRTDEALAAVERVERASLGRARAEQVRREESLVTTQAASSAQSDAVPAAAEATPSFRESLQFMMAPGMRGVTISAMLVWILPSLFSLVSFYAVILTEDRGMPLAEAIALITSATFFAPAGTLIAGFLSDLFGRKIACPLLAMAGVLGPVIAFVLAPVDDPVLHRSFVVFGIGLASAGISGMFGVMWGYTQESFPTKIRATALGLGNSFWRLSTVLGPLVIGAIYQTGGVQIAVYAGVVCGIVASTLFLIYGRETRGKGLDSGIAGTAVETAGNTERVVQGTPSARSAGPVANFLG